MRTVGESHESCKSFRHCDGESFVRHSATLSKRYRDKDGQWHDTDTLFTEDLFRVAMLAQRAAVWMDLKELSPSDEAGAA